MPIVPPNAATRRDALRLLAAGAALSGAGSGCGPREAPPADLSAGARVRGEEALERAADWFWSEAARTGAGWPSRVYGMMRLGQSTTPLALLALLAVPRRVSSFDRKAAGRALADLERLAGTDGALGFADVAPDYPVYATSMFVSALAAVRGEEARAAVGRSAGWLLSQQFRAADGWSGHPARGGFGMGSRAVPTPPNAGHVDLSMTRRAVEALVAAGQPPGEGALAEARVFVVSCQRPSGGFVYSPVEPILNKGRREGGPGAPSEGYGAPTCDGLLALRALGDTAGSPEIARGLAFLRDMHRPDVHPGVDDGAMGIYATAMKGNYRAGAARVFRALGGPEGWRDGLIRAITPEQARDGSFRNPVTAQKEDEPVIATAFAVEALSHALS